MKTRQREVLLRVLKARFENNMNRHKGLEWAPVQAKIEANLDKLWSLNEMERTGGEPDVVGYDKKTGEYIFYDCSAESPKGRRSLCYDRQALDDRKEQKPENSALDLAADMGIELLTEDQYRELQKLGQFDTKTSSWVKTLLRLGNSVVPFFVIDATSMSFCIITVQSHTMPHGDSVARSESESWTGSADWRPTRACRRPPFALPAVALGRRLMRCVRPLRENLGDQLSNQERK